MKDQPRAGFLTRDYRYVFLGGSIIALLGLSLLHSNAHPYSFLVLPALPALVCSVVFWAFLAFSAFALVIKLSHWSTYASTVLKRPSVIRLSRLVSYPVAAACVLTIVDRILLRFVYTIRFCSQLDSNPKTFGSSMIYMSLKGKDMLVTGIWTTIRIALLGTGIAFILAIFMVFLSIQEPD